MWPVARISSDNSFAVPVRVGPGCVASSLQVDPIESDSIGKQHHSASWSQHEQTWPNCSSQSPFVVFGGPWPARSTHSCCTCLLRRPDPIRHAQTRRTAAVLAGLSSCKGVGAKSPAGLALRLRAQEHCLCWLVLFVCPATYCSGGRQQGFLRTRVELDMLWQTLAVRSIHQAVFDCMSLVTRIKAKATHLGPMLKVSTARMARIPGHVSISPNFLSTHAGLRVHLARTWPEPEASTT